MSPQPLTPPRVSSASVLSPAVEFAPPAGFAWIDVQGEFALAGEKEPSEQGICEIFNTKSKAVVAKLTSASTVAGGATPSCLKLSPSAQLVQYGNGRGSVWKNRANQVTACTGLVSPDDATCVDDDVTQFMFQGKEGPAVDLDLYWSQAVVNGSRKKVATIPRGLNRDGGDSRWWTVTFCSPQKAIIDIQKGARVEIDAKSGAVKSTKASDGSRLCP